MRNDTIHLQPGNAIAEEATVGQRSYLSEILRNAFAPFKSARSRNSYNNQSDGLEALDMLGGWQGSEARRREKG